MLTRLVAHFRKPLLALLASSFISLWLVLLRIITTGSTFLSFLIWNLVLAWVPFVWSAWLIGQVIKRGWLSWQALSLTGLWLVFLPNTFYLITDFIHLQVSNPERVLLDAVLIMSFVWNGLILGFLSVWLVHRQLMKRFTPLKAHLIIALVLLLCSFAIYLGRFLRWNSWDLLVSPWAILFDLTNHVLDPLRYLDTFVTTGIFFVLLGSMYAVMWNVLEMLNKPTLSK